MARRFLSAVITAAFLAFGGTAYAQTVTGFAFPVPIGVPNGGTGLTTTTPHGLIVGEGVGAFDSIGVGTTGQCLISNGSAGDPGWSNCSTGSGGGGTGSGPGTIITSTSGGSLTDPSGNVYTDPGGTATENGTAMSGGGGTKELELCNGTIYASRDADTQTGWSTWSGSAFVTSQPPLCGSGTSGGGASPNGTYVTPGVGSIVDSSGNVWVITVGKVAEENNTAIPGGGGTGEIEWCGGVIFAQDATTAAWYTWNGSALVASSAPTCTPVSSGGGGTGGGGSSGVSSITAGTGITVGGSASSPVVNLAVPVVVAFGGTGLTTTTAHGVILGEGTAAFGNAGPGLAGQCLVSNGSTSDPTWGACGSGSSGGGGGGGGVGNGLTIAQTGTSPLTTAVTVTRNTGGLNDAPLWASSYNVDAADGGTFNYQILNFTTTVNGSGSPAVGPAGDIYAFNHSLYIQALKSLSAGANGSQAVSITAGAQKSLPTGGVPAGRRIYDMWSYWGPLTDNSNVPSSQGGDDVGIELDQNVNNLDDIAGRYIFQGTLTRALGTGYPAESAFGLYLSAVGGQFTWFHDIVALGGPYNQSAIDMRYASTYEPTITSSTPSSPVQSITVDNIMPLATGGQPAGVYGYLPTESTAATTGITASGAASGTSLSVSSVAPLLSGMYVYDLTNPGDVPANTTITVPSSGTTLTTNVSTTVASGDHLLFSAGQKPVTINGHTYIVAGVQFTTQNSTAGTVWFTGNVTVADATQNNVILPGDTHTIWLWEGQSSGPPAPPDDIAFNRGGTVTLSCNTNSNCTGVSVGGNLFLTGYLSLGNFGAGTAGQCLVSSGTSGPPSWGACGTGGGGGGTITGITAGTGLTGGGTGGNITISLATPVSIANGGTGQTAAGGATLDAISGFSGTTAGLVYRTGSGTYTITAVPLSPTLGGTGDNALNSHSVLVGEGTSAVGFTGTGTGGQCLVSGGSTADPTWATCGGTGTAAGVHVITTGTSYTALLNDYYIFFNSSTASAKTLTIAGCNATNIGISYDIVDEKGDASSNPITTSTSGGVGTINGATNYAINTAHGAVQMTCDGTSNYVITATH